MSEPGSMIRALSGRSTARNFHSYVIAEVGVGITSGRLAIGSVLPGDAEMMDRYGVSRTVLREAIKTIEAKGLVEARAKVGTRVLPRSRWNLFDPQVLGWVHEAGPDLDFLTSYLELRDTIELQIATLAATRRTAENLRMMIYWLNQRLQTATLVEPHAMAEFELHRMLGEATHNPLFRAAQPLVEFGVVRATLARVRAGVDDFADEKTALYDQLVQAISRAEAPIAAQTMQAILNIDRTWTLRSAGQIPGAVA